MILLHRLHAVNFKQLADVTICFPAEGSILIEGANEAGKSSLFEAIYFALYGRSLITEQDYKLPDLRLYGAGELRVELDFTIDDRPFHIERRVGSNHTARLTCPRAEGEVETITGIREIGRRLQEEMRLSADALLNTCFVEQKRLERLENLNPAERRMTINELLNLRVLTNLENLYRVTREDRDALQRQKDRVGIAQLDAEQPALEAQEQTARQCLRYTRLCLCLAECARLRQEIGAAEAERTGLAEQRARISEALAVCAHLHRLLAVLDDRINLCARAWQEAILSHERAVARVYDLERLAVTLPGRREQQAAWQALAEQLAALERLEAEARVLCEKLQAKQEELDRHDALQREWEAQEARRNEREEEREQAREALTTADAAWSARQTANQRIGRLALLMQHAAAHTQAVREISEIAARLQSARQSADRLPVVCERLQSLEAAEARLSRRNEARKERERVEADLTAAEKRKAEGEQRRQRAVALEEELARIGESLAARRQALQAAEEALHSAQIRAALADWVEAAERGVASDPTAGPQAALEARRAAGAQDLETAAMRARQAARRPLAGVLLAGAGGIVGVVGVTAGAVLLLGTAGLVILIVGIFLALRGRREAAAASAGYAAAKSACDTLEGESRALAAQAQASALHLQEWKEREAACRSALERLHLAVPATPEEARAQLAALPAPAVAVAHEEHRAAESALREAENEQTIKTQLLHTEQELAAASEPEAVAALIRSLTDRQESLVAVLRESEDLPGLLKALGVEEVADSLKAALTAARSDRAACEADAHQVGALERQHADKARQTEDEAENCRALAGEMALPGGDVSAWQSAAVAEWEALRAEKTATPDIALQERVETTRQALQAADRDSALLDDAQQRRQEELAARPRNRIIEEQQEVERAVGENATAQKPLNGVRATLQDDGLPVESAPLLARLAVIGADLDHDEAQAQELPAAREEHAAHDTEVQARAGELTAAWRANLPDEATPAAPGEAFERLPAIRLAVERRLSALDESALSAQDALLTARDQALIATLATCRHQAAEQAARQKELRQALGATGEETPDALRQRLPELRAADTHDSVGWEQAAEACKLAIGQNRALREKGAKALGLGEEPLDLQQEQAALVEADRQLKVKRRAGEIVIQTRNSIVNRVMPLTMQNMRRILPLLTEGRYQDAQWEEESNILSVYDTRARDYQRKRVFSGGARDQISLALRLAFALATLPGAHIMRPGWLFLDEPLSSFDRSRTQSLVELLTRGLIRQQFQQIMLISHSESFDPAQFDYRVRMESGSMVQSTLSEEPLLTG